MNFSALESLERLGFNASFQSQLATLSATSDIAANALVGRVIAEARGQFSIALGDGTRRAVLAGRLKHSDVQVCVGDFVLLEAEHADEQGLARIGHVFRRSSLFRRKAPGAGSDAQPIAANVDLAIIVCALAADHADPHARAHGLNVRRIERYLRAVRDAPARACVALNKADLSSSAAAYAERLQDELRGVTVLPVSAEHGEGLTALEQVLLPGSTAVLVGSSGVGKSSLTNRLLGRATQAVAAVRERDTRGRHTTTGRQLFALPNGALLIDTPGMREFALFADDDTDLAITGFAEIDELAPACRFRDCRHQSEPGCAVLAAVANGSVAGVRLEQAHKFERELAWQRERHDPQRTSEVRAARRALNRSARAERKRRGER